MSSAFPHARLIRCLLRSRARGRASTSLGVPRRPGSLPAAWLAGILVATGTLGCSDSRKETLPVLPGVGDEFGAEAEPFPGDGGDSLDAASSPIGDGESEALVRFVHGIVNLGPLYVCHDPDLALGDPLSPDSEEQSGPQPPVELPLVASFGEHGERVAVAPLTSGVLTLHRELPSTSDAGLEDAAAHVEAGGPAREPYSDAAASSPERCSPETRVAALPLSETLPQSVEAGGSARENYDDAGLPTTRLTALVQGPLTLVAAGLALDDARVTDRGNAVRANYLANHPGADTEAYRLKLEAEALLRATLGPVLTIESDQGLPVEPDTFRVTLTHLVPDVAGSEPGPGAVRMCVTAGTVENAVEPPLTAQPMHFRARTPLSAAYKVEGSYRLRVFAASKFDGDGSPGSTQGCGGTGLAPLAELTIAGFSVGRTYHLALLGAVAPNMVCAPVGPSNFAQPGCPLPADKLVPRLMLLE